MLEDDGDDILLVVEAVVPLDDVEDKPELVDGVL